MTQLLLDMGCHSVGVTSTHLTSAQLLTQLIMMYYLAGLITASVLLALLTCGSRHTSLIGVNSSVLALTPHNLLPVMSGYPKAPCLDHSFFLFTLLRYPKFLGSITFSSNSMQTILNYMSLSRRPNLTTRSLLCNHAWSLFRHGFVKTEWL